MPCDTCSPSVGRHAIFVIHINKGHEEKAMRYSMDDELSQRSWLVEDEQEVFNIVPMSSVELVEFLFFLFDITDGLATFGGIS